VIEDITCKRASSPSQGRLVTTAGQREVAFERPLLFQHQTKTNHVTDFQLPLEAAADALNKGISTSNVTGTVTSGRFAAAIQTAYWAARTSPASRSRPVQRGSFKTR
jgi:hypothetical protein